MNARLKKGIFWGAIVASMTLAISFIFNLIGGTTTLAAGFHDHGGPGETVLLHHHDVVVRERVLVGYHNEPAFPWIWTLIIIIILIAVTVLAVKSFRKKSQASSMQQFIDTSIMSTPKPSVNYTNATILDEWEKNNAEKKERM
ncbi:MULTISPECIES: hypothetical protein [Bacillaceae]|uniref:hypothetical protein n=1 Tax=Bacillaceae TaxID=186817 RepID=UPI001E540C0D|nr:hypothetical protein [Bacillus sp. Au-Bac7]MCE4050759.1 hypothetical protein [Bacillus sp. Au-Bac7]